MKQEIQVSQSLSETDHTEASPGALGRKRTTTLSGPSLLGQSISVDVHLVSILDPPVGLFLEGSGPPVPGISGRFWGVRGVPAGITKTCVQWLPKDRHVHHSGVSDICSDLTVEPDLVGPRSKGAP